MTLSKQPTRFEPMLDFFADKLGVRSRTKVWSIKKAGLAPRHVRIGGVESVSDVDAADYLHAIATGRIDLSAQTIRAAIQERAETEAGDDPADAASESASAA